MKNKSTMPINWGIINVGSIGRIETGSTPSKQNSLFYANDFPFYKPTDLEAGYNVRIAKDNLSEAGIKQARYLPENSILVTCIGATIGKTGLIRKAGASNQQINAIIPSENINSSFVYYQVIGPVFQKLIKHNASATTLPILNKTKFQSLPFVIAPIKVQQQIVSKIEELFSELDKGIEELKTAQHQLKVYRQAVLKWAFEGKLTNKDVKEGELPKEWKKLQVKDVCKTILGGGTPSTLKQKYWQGDIPWISSADIHGIKNVTPRRKITMEAVNNSATNVLPKGGIVVVTRVGLGKLAVAPYDLCFSQDSQGIVLNKALISTEYALLVLQKEVQVFKHQSRGTTINGVTKKQLADLIIALPPLKEQQQIVQEIESRLSVCDEIEETITNSLKQSEVLRQSILKKAFEGRLL